MQKTKSAAVRKAEEVQSFVREQWQDAQKRLSGLESEAQKVLRNLVADSRKELDSLLKAWEPGEWQMPPQLKELSRRAGAAGDEVRHRLDILQSRVVAAVGVATQSQVREISKELQRLSKKLDAVVGKKPTKNATKN